jgi:N-acetylglutamate synthase-like GNAT family acetyltransferase
VRQNGFAITMMAGANSPSPVGNVRLREAVGRDVEALRRLINAAFVVEQMVFAGDRIDDLEVRAYMGRGTFLVAEDSGGLAGCVYIETRDDRGYLGLLAVQPARQRTGLGRQLVAAAENLARESGSRVMDLRVISARGEQLFPFYQGLGYQFVRTEPFPPELVAKVPAHYILMSKPLMSFR